MHCVLLRHALTGPGRFEEEPAIPAMRYPETTLLQAPQYPAIRVQFPELSRGDVVGLHHS